MAKRRKSNENTPKFALNFKPTPLMKEAMRQALDPNVPPSITAYMEAAGSDQSLWYKWIKKEGFLKWWSETWRDGMKNKEPYFDKIGMIRALKDHKYWHDMQVKYFRLKEQEETVANSTPRIIVEFKNTNEKSGTEDNSGVATGETETSIIDII